jgi:hypothetical protein
MFDLLDKEPTWNERVENRVAPILDYGIDFYRKPTRVALVEALAAGIMLSLIFLVFNWTQNAYETVASTLIKIFLPTIGSYLAVWLLIKFSKGKANLIAPSWLLLYFLGTWIALILKIIPGAVADWMDPQQAVTLEEYSRKAVGAFQLFGFFSFVLLPLTASIHYFGGVLRLLRS